EKQIERHEYGAPVFTGPHVQQALTNRPSFGFRHGLDQSTATWRTHSCLPCRRYVHIVSAGVPTRHTWARAPRIGLPRAAGYATRLARADFAHGVNAAVLALEVGADYDFPDQAGAEHQHATQHEQAAGDHERSVLHHDFAPTEFFESEIA